MSHIEENQSDLQSQLTRRKILIGLAATGGVVAGGVNANVLLTHFAN